MRKNSLEQLIADIGHADAEEQAFDMVLERFGPTCAGWLLGRAQVQGLPVRAIVHAQGFVDFKIPAALTEEESSKNQYFFYAVEFLKRRPGWSVEVFAHQGIRRYRVKWLTWDAFNVSRETLGDNRWARQVKDFNRSRRNGLTIH